jgi:uncharacterized protein HemY
MELLPWSLELLAGGRQLRGQVQEEEDADRQQLAASKKLVQAFPAVSRYRDNAFSAQLCLGELLWGTGRRAEATVLLREGKDWMDRVSPGDANGHDWRAWILATCPDPQLRDARRAITLAQRATALAPKEQSYWVTLGAAYYRAGQWQDALDTLSKAEPLPIASIDKFFFLAMAHAKLGHKLQARQCYDQAVQLMEKHRPHDWGLRSFREEAEQVLGITKPAP